MCNLSCQLALGHVKLEILALSLSKTEAIYLEGTEVCPWRQSHLIKVTPHWNIHPLIGPLPVSWPKDGQTWGFPLSGTTAIYFMTSLISPFLLSNQWSVLERDSQESSPGPECSQWENSLNDKSISSTLLESPPDKWIRGTHTGAGEKCHRF